MQWFLTGQLIELAGSVLEKYNFQKGEIKNIPSSC